MTCSILTFKSEDLFFIEIRPETSNKLSSQEIFECMTTALGVISSFTGKLHHQRTIYSQSQRQSHYTTGQMIQCLENLWEIDAFLLLRWLYGHKNCL